MYLEEREDRRGRPREMPNGKRGMNFSVYLDMEEVEILHELKRNNDSSISKEIRKAVEVYIEQVATKKIDCTLDNWQQDPNYKVRPSLDLENKQKWENYIQNIAENKELIELSSMIKFIGSEIATRRTKEYLEKQKQKNPIYQYYKNKGLFNNNNNGERR